MKSQRATGAGVPNYHHTDDVTARRDASGQFVVKTCATVYNDLCLIIDKTKLDFNTVKYLYWMTRTSFGWLPSRMVTGVSILLMPLQVPFVCLCLFWFYFIKSMKYLIFNFSTVNKWFLRKKMADLHNWREHLKRCNFWYDDPFEVGLWHCFLLIKTCSLILNSTYAAI